MGRRTQCLCGPLGARDVISRVSQASSQSLRGGVLCVFVSSFIILPENVLAFLPLGSRADGLWQARERYSPVRPAPAPAPDRAPGDRGKITRTARSSCSRAVGPWVADPWAAHVAASLEALAGAMSAQMASLVRGSWAEPLGVPAAAAAPNRQSAPSFGRRGAGRRTGRAARGSGSEELSGGSEVSDGTMDWHGATQNHPTDRWASCERRRRPRRSSAR